MSNIMSAVATKDTNQLELEQKSMMISGLYNVFLIIMLPYFEGVDKVYDIRRVNTR